MPAATEMVNEALAVAPTLSVAVAVTLMVPTLVGVPVIAPVEESMLSPVPDSAGAVHVYGDVPPVALRPVNEKGLLTVALWFVPPDTASAWFWTLVGVPVPWVEAPGEPIEPWADVHEPSASPTVAGLVHAPAVAVSVSAR